MELLFFIGICIAIPILSLGALLTIYSKATLKCCTNHICLGGKTAIVTGANTGIGYATALDFAKRGARVILACRDLAKAHEAQKNIINATNNENIVVKRLDLNSFKSVRNFAKDIAETEKRLDILVNNAGILQFGVQSLTEDGYSPVMQVNYLSQFLLTLLLTGFMKEAASSRIINISSITVKYAQGFDVDKIFHPSGNFQNYSFSKLCMALFTVELAERLKNTGISVYSADPGAVNTGILEPDWIKYNMMRKLRSFMLRSPEEGAQTGIYCATEKGIEKYSGQQFVDCRPVAQYKTVTVPGVAKKLWRVTEEVVNLKEFE